MIEYLALLALSTTAVPVTNKQEDIIVLSSSQSVTLCPNSNLEFEDYSKNPTLTFNIPSKRRELGNTEDIFVSPVKSSIKVKMKVKIGGKVAPIAVDSEDLVYLDE